MKTSARFHFKVSRWKKCIFLVVLNKIESLKNEKSPGILFSHFHTNPVIKSFAHLNMGNIRGRITKSATKMASSCCFALVHILSHLSADFFHFSYMDYFIKFFPKIAVGNVSGYRCVSDCRSRGREFDPGPVPYFRGD